MGSFHTANSCRVPLELMSTLVYGTLQMPRRRPSFRFIWVSLHGKDGPLAEWGLGRAHILCDQIHARLKCQNRKPLFYKGLCLNRTNGKDNCVRLRTSSRTIGEDGSNPNPNPNPNAKPNTKPNPNAKPNPNTKPNPKKTKLRKVT